VKSKLKTVEEYCSQYEGDVREKLEELRALVKETLPDVEEKLSWGAPCYYLDGYLLMLAVNKNDIGFYTNKETVDHFRKEAAAYRPNQKNTIALPFEAPLPKELLRKMMLFCKDNR